MSILRIELAYTLIIMLGALSFGHTIAFWSPAESQMSRDLDLTQTQGTVFNILAPLGSILGGMLANFIGRYGRKRPLILTAIVAAIGWALIGLTQKEFRTLAFVMRGVIGVTTGLFSSICPLYIIELAPGQYRGIFGTFNQLGVMLGSTLAYVWGIFFEWRTIAFLLGIPAALLVFLIWFVIESPAVARQAVGKDRKRASTSIFQKNFLKPLLSASLLMTFQQFSGINAILSNLQAIFVDAGSAIDPAIASVLVGLAGALATLVTTYLVEHLGRRPSWNISCLGMAISLFLEAIAERFRNLPRILPVIFIFIANFTFNMGLGPIPWLIIPEMFPDEVRPIAMAAMTAVNWVFVTIVMFLWPEMKQGMGVVWSFVFYGLVLICAFMFGLLMLKETRGKEMGEDFEAELDETDEDVGVEAAGVVVKDSEGNPYIPEEV